MMLWQNSAKEHTEEGTSENEGEHDQPDYNEFHISIKPFTRSCQSQGYAEPMCSAWKRIFEVQLLKSLFPIGAGSRYCSCATANLVSRSLCGAGAIDLDRAKMTPSSTPIFLLRHEQAIEVTFHIVDLISRSGLFPPFHPCFDAIRVQMAQFSRIVPHPGANSNRAQRRRCYLEYLRDLDRQ